MRADVRDLIPGALFAGLGFNQDPSCLCRMMINTRRSTVGLKRDFSCVSYTCPRGVGSMSSPPPSNSIAPGTLVRPTMGDGRIRIVISCDEDVVMLYGYNNIAQTYCIFEYITRKVVPICWAPPNSLVVMDDHEST